ncbi:T9SS type B sorting domain-containing protein [Algibacter sp. R77976]|uniref:T9SS type B sorting domain-containing protein n=1 Tax=Algibacter sp. R77976 TaxID=3093873 RepID=UPI0037C5339A
MKKVLLNTYYTFLFIVLVCFTTKTHSAVLFDTIPLFNEAIHSNINNNENSKINLIPPTCTRLRIPSNGDTNVSVSTNFTWDFIEEATGYKITIGTSPGEGDILNAFDVGNSTIYNLPVNLPGNSNISVIITPYNDDGDALSCNEEFFSTGNSLLELTCTQLTQPLNEARNVSVETDLSWLPVPNATGYKLTIGTSPGATNILNNFDIGNTTTYNLSGNYPANTSISVTITPYNLTGNITGCSEEYFMTGRSAFAPNCTTLSIPMDNDTDVIFNTDITWLTAPDAIGYKINIGTTSGGTNILNNFDIGDTNSYNPTIDFPGNTRIFVNITPYNEQGNAIDCNEESFTTGEVFPVPRCTNLTLPLAGASQVPVGTDLKWIPVTDATGYILTVETFTENIDIYNRFDVGNITHYNIPGDLPENTKIYVIIEPYNLAGEAIGCSEEIFTTGKAGIHLPPKFFTPNNDGINDFWITPNPINRIASVNIYNRRGKLLKNITQIEKGWDGTCNGSKLPTDDYWYQIVYNDGETLLGHFSLKL